MQGQPAVIGSPGAGKGRFSPSLPQIPISLSACRMAASKASASSMTARVPDGSRSLRHLPHGARRSDSRSPPRRASVARRRQSAPNAVSPKASGRVWRSAFSAVPSRAARSRSSPSSICSDSQIKSTTLNEVRMPCASCRACSARSDRHSRSASLCSSACKSRILHPRICFVVTHGPGPPISAAAHRSLTNRGSIRKASTGQYRRNIRADSNRARRAPRKPSRRCSIKRGTLSRISLGEIGGHCITKCRYQTIFALILADPRSA